MKKISIFFCMTFLVGYQTVHCPKKSSQKKHASNSFYSWLKAAGIVGTGGIFYGVGKNLADKSAKEAAEQETQKKAEATKAANNAKREKFKDIYPGNYDLYIKQQQEAKARQTQLAEKKRLDSLSKNSPEWIEHQHAKVKQENLLRSAEEKFSWNRNEEEEAALKAAEENRNAAIKAAEERRIAEKLAAQENIIIKEKTPEIADAFTFTPETPTPEIKPDTPSTLPWGLGKVVDTGKNIAKTTWSGLYNLGAGGIDFALNHKLALAGATAIGFTLWKMGAFNSIANMFYTKQLATDFKKSSGRCNIQFRFTADGQNRIVEFDTYHGNYHSCHVLNKAGKPNPGTTNILRNAIKEADIKRNVNLAIQTMLKTFCENAEDVTAQVTISLQHNTEKEELDSDSVTFTKGNDEWLNSIHEFYLVQLKDYINQNPLSDITKIKQEEAQWIANKGASPVYCITLRKKNVGWASMFRTSSGFASIEGNSIQECYERFVAALSMMLGSGSKPTEFIIEPSVRYDIDSEQSVVYNFHEQTPTFHGYGEGDYSEYTDYFIHKISPVFEGKQATKRVHFNDQITVYEIPARELQPSKYVPIAAQDGFGKQPFEDEGFSEGPFEEEINPNF